MKIKINGATAVVVLNNVTQGVPINPCPVMCFYVQKFNTSLVPVTSKFLIVGASGNYTGSSLTVGTNSNNMFELTDDTFLVSAMLAQTGLTFIPVDDIEF